eukprot:14307904-Alexandrium_andersonii.AAC.1
MEGVLNREAHASVALQGTCAHALCVTSPVCVCAEQVLHSTYKLSKRISRHMCKMLLEKQRSDTQVACVECPKNKTQQHAKNSACSKTTLWLKCRNPAPML